MERAQSDVGNDSRMELRRRIDAELAEMSDIPVSSYLMAEKPVEEISVPHGPVASEIEVDSAIGRLLWHAGERLDQSPCFHVNGPDSTLIAVACVPTGRLSVRPGCAWEHLEHLKLTPRPAAAAAAPPGYRAIHRDVALWRFALFGRQGAETLPRHYRLLPLRLRAKPELDRAHVAGRHGKLMRLLTGQSRTFRELRELTGLSDAQLSRDLGALALLRCIGPA
jgi:hypothetical protein